MIGDYVSVLENHKGLFKSLNTKFSVQRNSYGEIEVRSGNDACVFRLNTNSNPLMLKCYIKEVAFLSDKYTYLNKIAPQSDFIPKIKFLEKELFVYDNNLLGQWTDILVGDWLEGNLLSVAIDWAVRRNDLQSLMTLTLNFDRMACTLINSAWAHGDIKPDNIMVSADNKLTLIDFDAMYFPGIESSCSGHLGTPSFQHPLRDETFFNRHLDDYSLILISVSLHALCCDLSLYTRFHSGDNIFLNPDEILAGNSPAYKELQTMWQDEDSVLRLMVEALSSPTAYIDRIADFFENVK